MLKRKIPKRLVAGSLMMGGRFLVIEVKVSIFGAKDGEKIRCG
jgi:hypothetical protein